MNYTQKLSNYLNYVKIYYDESYFKDVQLYFSTVEKYLYPKIEEINKTSLRKCINTLTKDLVKYDGVAKNKTKNTLYNLYYQLMQFIYQQESFTKGKNFHNLLDLYFISNPTISNIQKRYLGYLITHINLYHLNKTTFQKLESITEKHLKGFENIGFNEEFIDHDILCLIFNIGFQDYIKGRGVNYQ